MFFSNDILQRKKGGFGVVWIAATVGHRSQARRLKRTDILSVNVASTCKQLQQPGEKLALRLSSNLMVGVARIYGQQVSIFGTDVATMLARIKHSNDVRSLDASISLVVQNAKRDAITLAPNELNHPPDMAAAAFDGPLALLDFTQQLNNLGAADQLLPIEDLVLNMASASPLLKRKANYIDRDPFSRSPSSASPNGGSRSSSTPGLTDEELRRGRLMPPRPPATPQPKQAAPPISAFGFSIGDDADDRIPDFVVDHGGNPEMDVPFGGEDYAALYGPVDAEPAKRPTAPLEQQEPSPSSKKRRLVPVLSMIDVNTTLLRRDVRLLTENPSVLMRPSPQPDTSFASSAHSSSLDLSTSTDASVLSVNLTSKQIDARNNLFLVKSSLPIRDHALQLAWKRRMKYHMDVKAKIVAANEKAGLFVLSSASKKGKGGGEGDDVRGKLNKTPSPKRERPGLHPSEPDDDVVPFGGYEYDRTPEVEMGRARPSIVRPEMPWSSSAAVAILATSPAPSTQFSASRGVTPVGKDPYVMDTPGSRRSRSTVGGGLGLGDDDLPAMSTFSPDGSPDGDDLDGSVGDRGSSIASDVLRHDQATSRFFDFMQAVMGGPKTTEIWFTDLIPPAQQPREVAAEAFFHVLVLATRGVVQPAQQKETDFDDILVSIA